MTAPHPHNLHEDLSRPDEVSGASDRRFGLTMAAVLAAIGAVRLGLGHGYWQWWLGGAAVLALLAAVWPAGLRPLNRFWLGLGLVLYRIVNPVVMALLYYTTIVPIGLLLRLCGKDPLRLQRDPAAASYWIVRAPPGPLPETMRNQF